jgi:hypothetical protein
VTQPKKPHPASPEASLGGDQAFKPPVPIERKKTIFSPEKVCAYMSAVLLEEIVLTEKPPVQIQPLTKVKK